MVHIGPFTSVLCIAALATSTAAQLTVQSTTPSMNANNAARSGSISVTFDRAVDQSTFTTARFHAFGKVSGPISGPLTFSNSDRTVTLTPAAPFMAGEVVLVTLASTLRAADGSFLRSQGYSFMFTTGVNPTYHLFTPIGTLSNRDATGAQTRIYGGLSCDLNCDGLSDFTTINEVSADLRVMLNTGNPSAPFASMLTPYVPIPYESSPNEVADFDRDGFIDVVTSSNAENRIAIIFGNGDGTFDTPIEVPTGDYPRGFGILDVDGDGDLDITVANNLSGNVAILRNNGNRTFAAPTTVAVPGGPYGLAAAEMTNDGIIDLVVGTSGNQQCYVLRGNGNGTFTIISNRALGGSNWVVMCADVDNDGDMDVSTANSSSANGSILKNTGSGSLGVAAVIATGGHTVSTDFADIDGDGDQDWVLSSFGAGTWYLYLNNGSGTFTPAEEFDAPANPSCAVPVDFDNDGDIDLALTDEIADVIILLRNDCSPIDYNNDGLYPDTADIDDFLTVFSGGPCSTGDCNAIDFNNDGLFPDTADIDALLSIFSGGACV
ncbi:MAG TPA: FG-GAP-like repeat-containing protein [Phycisphaerales bacterium]|nr:FG-GAP-like repeat-containing protein [Phycisphaerales bacterium]